MPVKLITSRENPFFRSLLALAESRQERRAKRQTLLDGDHLLDEAMASGILPSCIVLTVESVLPEAWQDRLSEVPTVQVPPTLFRKLSPVATPTGLLAVIDTPQPVGPAGNFIVLIENIQEPGNLGALLRTAAAAGADAAYLSKGCAEAWSPKALRGSQGGHFRLAIYEDADLPQVASAFQGTVYAASLRSEQSLYDLNLVGPTAFAFGNEGAGLSETLVRAAKPFSIPMPGKAESLNVAAAAAVCMFERVRQLTTRGGA